jgi:hypothetical protein
MHMLVSEFLIYPEACWFEVGSWKLEVGREEGRKLEVGSWKSEVGSEEVDDP